MRVPGDLKNQINLIARVQFYRLTPFWCYQTFCWSMFSCYSAFWDYRVVCRHLWFHKFFFSLNKVVINLNWMLKNMTLKYVDYFLSSEQVLWSTAVSCYNNSVLVAKVIIELKVHVIWLHLNKSTPFISSTLATLAELWTSGVGVNDQCSRLSLMCYTSVAIKDLEFLPEPSELLCLL